MFNLFKIIFYFFLFSSFLFAQSKVRESKLPEIIVTATKTETSAGEIANSITIIDSDEIARSHKSSVVDLLKDETGITVAQQGGPGKLSNFFIRGANSNHTLVLIDGVEMNDPSSPNNAYDLSTLQTNNIERIEIVRGPQSALYGTDAMAGVINIITKKGEEKPVVSLTTEGGSNNHFKGGLNASGKYKRLNFSAGLSRIYTDGISVINQDKESDEKDKYSGSSISANIGYEIGASSKINFLYRFVDSKNDLDHSEKFGDDPNYTFENEEQVFRGEFQSAFFSGFWKTKLSSSFMKKISSGLDEADDRNLFISSRTNNNAERLKFEWQNNLHISEKNILTFGIERETESANTSYFSESEFGPYSTEFPETSVWNNGIYIQNQMEAADGLFTTAGARFENHEMFGSVFTYRGAAAYFLKESGTKLKATFGTGFKAPSLFYLFDPAFGNPDLEPEKSAGWDLGFEQFFFQKNISLEFVYFRNDYKDIFGFDENFRTVNIDRAETYGFESGFKVDNFFNFNFSGGYIYTVPKNKSKGSEDYNLQLLRRPKSKILFGADYSVNKKLYLGLDVRYTGKRADKDFSVFPFQRVELDAYTLIDLNASYNLTGNIEFYGKVNNVFDEDYEEVLFYGTLGRAFYLGLNINY